MSLSSGTPCTVCNCTTCSDCIPDIYYVAPKMPLCGNRYLHSTHTCTVTFTRVFPLLCLFCPLPQYTDTFELYKFRDFYIMAIYDTAPHHPSLKNDGHIKMSLDHLVHEIQSC